MPPKTGNESVLPYHLRVWIELRDDFFPLTLRRHPSSRGMIDGRVRMVPRPGVWIDNGIFSRRWNKWIDRLSRESDECFAYIEFISLKNFERNKFRIAMSWGYIAAVIALSSFLNLVYPGTVQEMVEVLPDFYLYIALFVLAYGIVSGLQRIAAEDLASCIEFSAIYRKNNKETRERLSCRATMPSEVGY